MVCGDTFKESLGISMPDSFTYFPGSMMGEVDFLANNFDSDGMVT